MDFLYFEKINKGITTRKSINSVDKYCVDNSLMGRSSNELKDMIEKMSNRWPELTPDERNYLFDLENEISYRN